MAIHGSRSCLEPTDPDFRAHPSSLPFLTVPTAFPKVSYGFIWLAHEIRKTRMGALRLPCRGRGCERPRSEPPRGAGRPRPAGRYLAPSPRRGVTWGTLRQGGGNAVQPGLLVRVEGVHLFGNSEIYSSHGVPTGNQGRGKTPRRPRNAWPLSWSRG